MANKEVLQRVPGSIVQVWDEGPFRCTREWYVGHHARDEFLNGNNGAGPEVTVFCMQGWMNEEQTMVETRGIRPVQKITVVDK